MDTLGICLTGSGMSRWCVRQLFDTMPMPTKDMSLLELVNHFMNHFEHESEQNLAPTPANFTKLGLCSDHALHLSTLVGNDQTLDAATCIQIYVKANMSRKVRIRNTI